MRYIIRPQRIAIRHLEEKKKFIKNDLINLQSVESASAIGGRYFKNRNSGKKYTLIVAGNLPGIVKVFYRGRVTKVGPRGVVDPHEK